MEFEQQAQEDLYARVASYLERGFGETAEPLEDEHPGFIVHLGGHSLLVSVNANGPELASILVFTRVGGGITITPELTTLLLRRSHNNVVGTVGLNEDDMITVHHLMFGETVTKDTLSRALHMMADYARELDDELTMRFR
jgi:hypothetical protein